MKILLIHNYYRQYGGEDAVVDAEKDLLHKYGHNVITYFCNNALIDTYAIYKKIHSYLNMSWSKENYLNIRNLIQREKPDIAHIHNTFFSITPSSYYACKEMNVPVVQTLHNYRFLCPGGNLYTKRKICEECPKCKNFNKSLINGCWRNSTLLTAAVAGMLRCQIQRKTFQHLIDRYIAPSDFCRNKFIEYGYEANKISVKPNFVPAISPKPTSRFGPPYALFVGRLTEEKGVLLLISSWKKLKDFSLKIIGTGELLRKLKILVDRDNLNLDFIGQKGYTEVIEYMKNAAFLIVPSKCFETFGRVIIESFACSTPVIATNFGATGELVEDKKTGLLFEYGNADSLVEQVRYLWNNADLRREMGKNARIVYEQKYTEKENYAVLIDIYKQVLLTKK
ncbi:MAG: glycosyltransferase family 4 protein [Atribacterota bacterium]|nr:glycosyltransferase family 4 protein [Atribacterota bacterium]